MIQIDPKDGVPIYRQVMDQIKLQVMTGKLMPGQQLESVSSLSGRLKVNPMTISKAYGFLVEEGVVDRRKGVGIFVAEVDQTAADENRRQLLSGDPARGRRPGSADGRFRKGHPGNSSAPPGCLWQKEGKEIMSTADFRASHRRQQPEQGVRQEPGSQRRESDCPCRFGGGHSGPQRQRQDHPAQAHRRAHPALARIGGQPSAHRQRNLGPDQVGRIGYVSQESELMDWLTVGETLDFVSAHHPTWDSALADRLLARFRTGPRSQDR